MVNGISITPETQRDRLLATPRYHSLRGQAATILLRIDIIMTHKRACALAAVAIALGGCGNPRADAREELRQLRAALEQHAKEYGRYPETVDPARPASATNLPHRPKSGVSVELVHAGADGFQALARRQPWICSMNVDARHVEKLKCAPLTGLATDAPGDSVRSPSPLETRP